MLAEHRQQKEPGAAPQIQHPAMAAEVIRGGERPCGPSGNGFDAFRVEGLFLWGERKRLSASAFMGATGLRGTVWTFASPSVI